MAGFIDKVVVGINKGVNSVSEGSKLIVEKAKLNTQIQDIEKEKNQLLINMGKLVYNLQMSGEIQIEQCAGICDGITQAEQMIADLQSQLQALETPRPQYYGEQNVQQTIENGVRCQCGFVNKETANFCAKCGQQLQ